MTNREVLNALSDRKLARLIVKFGIECRACPARDACAGHWIPCEDLTGRNFRRLHCRKIIVKQIKPTAKIAASGYINI